METADLLFTIQLRHLAVELRSTARAQYYAGIFDTCDEPQRRVRLAEWEQEHSLDSFIPVAFEEVTQIAEHVRELRAERGK